MDSTRLRVHKIRLSPNNHQRGYLAQSAGVSRFAYNWALATWQQWYEEYKNGVRDKTPSHRAIRDHLTNIKRVEYPWMLNVSKCVPQEAIAQLGAAFDGFFKGRAKYPKFKKKGKSRDSFKITGDHIKVDGKHLRISKSPGWIKMTETLRYEGRIISVTFSRTSNHWYASTLVEVNESAIVDRKVNHDPRPILGIDVGVHELVASDGIRYAVPRAYRAREAQLKRAQRDLSRKVIGSKNREKARQRVARIHARTASTRQDWLHKTTTELVVNNRVICLEDLNTSGMIKRSSGLSKSILDAGFYEFKRQIMYKVDQSPSHGYVLADRYYPSSKLCSKCGTKTKSLPLRVRSWTCESCGAVLDRDLNAAVNLENYAGGSSVSVCGRLYASAGSDVAPDSVSVPVEAEIDHHSLILSQ